MLLSSLSSGQMPEESSNSEEHGEVQILQEFSEVKHFLLHLVPSGVKETPKNIRGSKNSYVCASNQESNNKGTLSISLSHSSPSAGNHCPQ